MAESDETKDSSTETKDNNKPANKLFISVVAALTLLIFLIGGYIVYILRAPKGDVASEKSSAPTIGIIRIKDAVKAHKDYGEVEELKKRYDALLTEIMALSEPVDIKIPEADEELFQDSAQQKLSQTIVDKVAVLEEKRRVAVEKYVKDTAPAYEKKRAEIDERYLTAIADLRMKLDNSDILRLSDAKIKELSDQLYALQRERGETQEALKAEREKEIYNYGEKVIASMSKEIADVETEAEKLRSAASLKESETMERNMRLLEDSLGGDRILQIREKEDALAKLRDEIYAKEDMILADIASLAAKHAIQKNLEIVVSDMGVNIKSMLPEELQSEKVERYSRVIAPNALDITDDIIQDLN